MKRLACILLVMLISVLSGCGNKNQMSEKTVFAMDTVMTLKAYGPNGETALELAAEEIDRLDRTLDRGREGSDIYDLNTAGAATVSRETAGLISVASEISRKTEGAFDITIAPVMDLWGFYSGEYHVPDSGELADALKTVGGEIAVNGDSVTLESGTKIDMGAIAKGFASQKIAELFAENGVTSGIISLGGNVQAIGSKPDGSPWIIGIQDPDGDGIAGELLVSDKAVVTSGGYQRFFESGGKTYHHIIDPSTGCPAESGLKSVTVVSGDGVLADALSTALFVMGLDRASEFWRGSGGFEAVFITDDRDVYITDGLLNCFDGNEYKVIT